MIFYALYQRRVVDHYEGGGSDSECILGIDMDKDALRKRFNEYNEARRKTYEDQHVSYLRRACIPDEMTGDTMSYYGSTSGGCASVTYYVSIREFEQFDREPPKY